MKLRTRLIVEAALVVTLLGIFVARAQIPGSSEYGLIEAFTQTQGDARYLRLSGGTLTGTVDGTSWRGTGVLVTKTMSKTGGDESLLQLTGRVNKIGGGDDTLIHGNYTDTASPGTSRLISMHSSLYPSAPVFEVGPGTATGKSTIYGGLLELTTTTGTFDIRPSSIWSNVAFYVGTGSASVPIDLRTAPINIGDGTYVVSTYYPTWVAGTGTLLTEGAVQFQSDVLAVGPVTSVDCVGTVLQNAGPTYKRGTVVMADASTDNNFIAATADSIQPIGVLYSTTCAHGAWCRICTSGRALVWNASSINPVRGYWCMVSNEAGRADCDQADPPGVTEHTREIGHSLQTQVLDGQSSYIMLHFN